MRRRRVKSGSSTKPKMRTANGDTRPGSSTTKALGGYITQPFGLVISHPVISHTNVQRYLQTSYSSYVSDTSEDVELYVSAVGAISKHFGRKFHRLGSELHINSTTMNGSPSSIIVRHTTDGSADRLSVYTSVRTEAAAFTHRRSERGRSCKIKQDRNGQMKCTTGHTGNKRRALTDYLVPQSEANDGLA